MSDASQIKILSGGAMKSLMVEVVPLFERASGTKVEIKFALTSVLKKEVEAGAAFDIALLPRPELDALIEAGRIAAGTQTDITRSAVGLAVLATPIVTLLFQHGRFTAHDTAMTALALQAYAIGLAGYAAIRLITPCFYALNLPQTPMRITMIGIAVNLLLNFLNMAVFHLGHAGLALATSCVVLANVSQLAWALSKQVDFGGAVEWASYLGRVLLASAACGAPAPPGARRTSWRPTRPAPTRSARPSSSGKTAARSAASG